MGGEITIESEEGIGSTFTLVIPNVKTGAQHFQDPIKLKEENNFLNKEINEIEAIKQEENHEREEIIQAINGSELLGDTLCELEKLYSGIWYECSKCNRLKDIKEFSDQIMKIVNNKELDELLIYSKKIYAAAEKFNSAEIRDLLRLFPEIIEKYRRTYDV